MLEWKSAKFSTLQEASVIDHIASVIGMLTRLVKIMLKAIQALRADGCSFDPQLIDGNGDEHIFEVHVYPGFDEVVFDRLRVDGFDLSNIRVDCDDRGLVRYTSDGHWVRDALSIRLKMNPKRRAPKEDSIMVAIRPRKSQKQARFVLSGGFLNRLIAKRVLD